MTTYRALKGYNIKSVTSDPANTKEGQIWYNSTTSSIKLSPVIGAWASGGNLNSASRFGGGIGTQTAAAKFSGTGTEKVNEEYDGSTEMTAASCLSAIKSILAGDL